MASTVEKRLLGASGIAVAPIGLGCMSLSGTYGAGDDAVSIALIHEALDRGVTMLDSSDMYGFGHNEELVGKAIAGRRDQVMLATKFGNMGGRGSRVADGRPDYVPVACDLSLKRLGVDVIDLYYQHRVDTEVPIEDTVGAMAKLVQQGKVRALGLSEAAPDTIRRAHKVHPIAAVQSEYSLLYRIDAEETLRTTREFGISFVAYSPLGRGLLTGQVGDPTSLPDDDARKRHPRFVGENFTHNRTLVASIAAIAREKSCTPAQLVLAWLLAQGSDVIPIPGTKHRERLIENLGSLDVTLSVADVARIAAAIPPGAAAGGRYPERMMAHVHV
jgi:aryl-alcohol dehydrogenase-like predicted oxidoreductase